MDLLSNNTLVLVELSLDSNPIGCKWVFKRKYNTNSYIQTFKAILIAKDFTQKKGVDYFDTYFPVVRITFIRVLFALASIYKLYVYPMDVKNDFFKWRFKEGGVYGANRGFYTS